MNETEKHNLRVNQVEFVNNLEATDILDYLLEDGIFTENDCELISNSKTRRERAQLLLAMLPTRGPDAYGSFKRALNLGKYDFLGEKLSPIHRTNQGKIEFHQNDCSRKANELQSCMYIVSGCQNALFQLILKQHIFVLIDNVEPRDIIDHFYQEHIVGQDEVEMIRAEKTRKERCLVFVRELSKSSSNILVNILLKSLEKKYNYIRKEIQKTIENNSHSNINNNRKITNEQVPRDVHQEKRKAPHTPRENEEFSNETCLKELNHTPSVTQCKRIHNRVEVFDQTGAKKLNHKDTTEEIRIPTENTESFTEAYPNVSAHMTPVTPCKQIYSRAGIFDQTQAKDFSCTETIRKMCGPTENTESFTETYSNVSCHAPSVLTMKLCLLDENKIKDASFTETTKKMCGPSENTDLFTETFLVASGHMPSFITCERPNMFDQTNTKHVDCTETVKEMCGPTENTELFTETFSNNESGITHSVIECHRRDAFDHTQTEIKQATDSLNMNDPCEHEVNTSSVPGQQLEFSLLSSSNHSNSDEKKKVKVSKVSKSAQGLVDENCNSTSSPDLQNSETFKLDLASLENVADSAGIIPQRNICDMSHGNIDKTKDKRLYLSQISTDSETEENTAVYKKQRKLINKKKIQDKHMKLKADKNPRGKGELGDKNIKNSINQSNETFSTGQNIQMVGRSAYTNCISNYQPDTTNSNLPGRHLIVTFNYLSTLINQGNFDKFELFSSNLHRRYAKDPDMICLLGYLHASRDLFKTDFDTAKKHIDRAFEIVPKTSNPKYFTLELFTSKTRMYITQKKLEKLQNALDDAKMIIETDPMGCTGRAAGWLYMNDARNCTAQIGLLNFRNPNAITASTKLHKRAKTSFEKALINFQRDGGKDGPFGFGYALCRLAILLLQCGDNGRTMDILLPPEEDITLAGKHLQHLEDSEIAIPKILEMHFVLAKCDYQFRRKNTVRALEYAELAHKIASELKLFEFTEHAHNRCLFLRTKTPLVIDEVSEEEFTSILLGDTQSSE